MGKILLHLAIGEDFHAGSKAMKDCETVLQKKGYSLMNINHAEGKLGIIGKTKNECQFLKFFSLKKDDILVIQHPLYIGSRYMKWLKTAKSLKKFKTIFIIHDLESLRKMFKEWGSIFEKIDSDMLDTADSMIVHNSKMIEYLSKERGVPINKMVNLEVFDYITTEKKGKHFEKKLTDLAIAGNLRPEKSGYIYKLLENCPELSVNLYGVGFQKEKTERAEEVYRGAFPPDILPGKLEGRFGLVWDGQEIFSCVGTTGEYLKFNNPHKVSLYMAAGMPVIIWKEAALAEFVVKKNIGIAVKDLYDLKNVIDGISEQEYTAMKKNAEKIADGVRRGTYMETALEKAESIVRNS